MADGIGGRIAKRRQALRMTQEELAAKLGVSRNAVASWESGKHFPKRKLGAIEQVLGVSLNEEPEPEEPGIPPDMAEMIREEFPDDATRRRVTAIVRQAYEDLATGESAPSHPARRRRRAG